MAIYDSVKCWSEYQFSLWHRNVLVSRSISQYKADKHIDIAIWQQKLMRICVVQSWNSESKWSVDPLLRDLLNTDARHQHTKQWKHLTETKNTINTLQMQRPKEVASELRRTSYKHTLWKLTYIIQEMNTCYHQWAAQTLSTHNQYCAPIWELTWFNQIKCCCKLCS